MSASEADVLILVLVAPMQPYPELFATGPRATWMNDHVPGVQVAAFGAAPLGGFRRQLGDLRELLRFPGASPDEVGTVDGSAPVVRGWGAITNLASQSHDLEGPRKTAAWIASKSILAASHGVSAWDRDVTSKWKNNRTARVTKDSDLLRVHKASTISNSMAIQQAMIRSIVKGPRRKGVLFVTSSAYVDQRRLLAWVDAQGPGPVVGGTHALANRGSDDVFMSGFCQYFSWDVLERIAAARDFDHSLPNDGAMTKWLLAHGIPWTDPGIEWFNESMADGRCPLCADPEICVVRCTSHGSRWREAEFMQQLHHEHAAP